MMPTDEGDNSNLTRSIARSNHTRGKTVIGALLIHTPKVYSISFRSVQFSSIVLYPSNACAWGHEGPEQVFLYLSTLSLR